MKPSTVKLLNVLAEKFEKKINDSLESNHGEYGGKGEFNLPDDHKAAMIVPKGGSSCANCKFARILEDGPHCSSEYWIKWNGGDSRLPVDDPSTYCSDWYTPL